MAIFLPNSVRWQLFARQIKFGKINPEREIIQIFFQINSSGEIHISTKGNPIKEIIVLKENISLKLCDGALRQ